MEVKSMLTPPDVLMQLSIVSAITRGVATVTPDDSTAQSATPSSASLCRPQ